MKTPQRPPFTKQEMDAFEAAANKVAADAKAESQANPKPAYNAIIHGLTAAKVCLAHENQAEYDQLLADLRRENAPRNSTEDACVNQMAQAYWKINRVSSIEKALWELEMEDAVRTTSPIHKMAYAFHKCGDITKALDKLHRYGTEARRAFHNAATTLRQHQKWAKNKIDVARMENLNAKQLIPAMEIDLEDIGRYEKYRKLADETDSANYAAAMKTASPPPSEAR